MNNLTELKKPSLFFYVLILYYLCLASSESLVFMHYGLQRDPWDERKKKKEMPHIGAESISWQIAMKWRAQFVLIVRYWSCRSLKIWSEEENQGGEWFCAWRRGCKAARHVNVFGNEKESSDEPIWYQQQCSVQSVLNSFFWQPRLHTRRRSTDSLNICVLVHARIQRITGKRLTFAYNLSKISRSVENPENPLRNRLQNRLSRRAASGAKLSWRPRVIGHILDLVTVLCAR